MFGSCVIHILYTGRAKIKKNSGTKGLSLVLLSAKKRSTDRTESVGKNVFNTQVIGSVAIYMKTSSVQHRGRFCVIFSGISGFSGYVETIPASTR